MGSQMETVFLAIARSLPEKEMEGTGEGGKEEEEGKLYQSSPIKFFLEVKSCNVL